MDNDTKQFILTETEKLAEMIAKGFAAVDRQFAEVHEKMATKEDMQRGFAEVNTRLDRIEHSVEKHGTDIDRLTDDVRVLKTAAGMS